MEYQKIIIMLNNTTNQTSRFRTKYWIEINDDFYGTYNTNNQIRFKTSMLKSSLYDYSDAYILVKGNITVIGAGVNDTRTTDRKNKKAIFKNCPPFTDCITEINNTQVDNVKDLDVALWMYNLIEYSDNYSKTSKSLYQIFRHELHATTTDSELFKFKSRFLDNNYNVGIINTEIAVPLKKISNFWRALEMPLVNCEKKIVSFLKRIE